MSVPTDRLTAEGVSIWLDDLSRQRITTGNLAELIGTRNVSGVTTNPTIFAGALSAGDAYQSDINALSARGVDRDSVIEALTTADVRDACDILRPLFDASNGADGRVSIEVSPLLAHDATATVESAKHLWAVVDRPNVLIKIPATRAGLTAISDVLAVGISVNVTLIFSIERYADVIEAYLRGLERARHAGLDLGGVHSVASFFVSRVDTEVNQRLVALGTPEAEALKNRAGIANARLAYELFEKQFATDRAKALTDAGANVQRPLWASTGVKDPVLADTMYVTQLVAPHTVNTMPEKTLEATFHHAVIDGDTITGAYADAHDVIETLAAVGVDFADVAQVLEDQGVEKFIDSWHELQATVSAALENATASAATR